MKEIRPEANIPEHPIQFDSLGERVGKIVEGMHANSSAMAGQYKHPELGDLFVKQESKPTKTLVEWAFYQVAKAVLSATGQQDILARMAPIVLITPQKTNNAAKDVYVGSVSHTNMDLLWKGVYAQAHPGKKIPKKRIGPFERIYKKEILSYIEKFNQQDAGFSMMPVLALLGHHAMHFGNLGFQKEGHHKKMVFFDYGAAAWYDLNNQDFGKPKLKGTIGYRVVNKVFGFSKNYMENYIPAFDAVEARKYLLAVNTEFQKNYAQVATDINTAMKTLAEALDHESLLKFAKYIRVTPKIDKRDSKEEAAQAIGDYLFTRMANRINAIPAHLKQYFSNEVRTSESGIFGKQKHLHAEQVADATSETSPKARK